MYYNTRVFVCSREMDFLSYYIAAVGARLVNSSRELLRYREGQKARRTRPWEISILEHVMCDYMRAERGD